MNFSERKYIPIKLPTFVSKFAILIDGGLSIYFFNLISYLNKLNVPLKAFKKIDPAINWRKEN